MTFQNSFEPLLLNLYPQSMLSGYGIHWKNCVCWMVAGMAKLGLKVKIWLVHLSYKVNSEGRPKGLERERGCENRYPRSLPLIPSTSSSLFSTAAGSRLQPLSLPHGKLAVHLESTVGGEQGEIRKFHPCLSLQTSPCIQTGNALVLKHCKATFLHKVSWIIEARLQIIMLAYVLQRQT